MMLKAVIRDEVAFTGWVNANMKKELITADTWHVAKTLIKFLKIFYEATICLSGELAKRRAQHTAENKELMATFENLALEEEEEE